MSNTPDNLKFTESHEWLRDLGDNTVEIGITDHAQDALGELVFVEVDEPGTEVDAGDECGTVESVKSASDIFTPVAGTIAATNDALEDDPGRVNNDPYGDGWLLRVTVNDAAALDSFMDAAAYEAFCSQDD